MPRVAPAPPPPTPEYEATAPRPGESGLDPLTRVGQAIVDEFGGSEQKDRSRKNTKMPKQLAALVALRAQGYDNAEIAERLGVKVAQVRNLVKRARVEYGWSDLGEKLAHVAVPQAIDNVVKHLEHEGTKMAIAQGQHTMTLKTLAGVGVFKTHSAVKQENKSEETRVLRVEVVLPTIPAGADLAAEGTVFATPRRPVAALEGTVLPATT